jgi:WD40 repeat protein
MFHPGGRRLVSSSADGTVRLWDAKTGEEALLLRGHTGVVLSLAVSPKGDLVASAGLDGTVRVWDLMAAPGPLTLRGYRGTASSVAFSPDGRRLAVGLEDGTVRTWDPTTGQELLTLRAPTNFGVKSIAFSPDGRHLAAAYSDILRIWDVETGQVVRTCTGHSRGISALAYSPDGLRLASVSRKDRKTGEVKIWDATTGQEILAILDPTEFIRGVGAGVAFSPDGLRLATANEANTVQHWDATTGRLIHTFQGHTAQVLRVAYSPKGQYVASASDDGTAKLWDTTTGQEAFTLRGHTREVSAVAFNSDGTRLATASNDQTVKLWHVASGLELLTLRGHTGAVLAVAFSRDGQRMASAGHDETVRVWDATPLTPEMRLQRQAGALVNRLTADLLFKDEVVAQLRGDTSLSEPLRQQSLVLAERYREDPERFRQASWDYVRHPGAEAAKYQIALRLAKAGLDATSPKDEFYWRFLYTLGVAQYRVGQWQESVDTLTKADASFAVWYKERLGDKSSPPGVRLAPALAFLAMAHHQIGHKEEARAIIAGLREILKLPQWARHVEAKGFAREAETLIEGKAPDPKK